MKQLHAREPNMSESGKADEDSANGMPAEASLWAVARRKFFRDKVGVAAMILVLIYFIAAVGVWLGLWAREWDELINEDGYAPVSSSFWLGANFNGQDIFQRAMYSTRAAFEVGAVVAFFSIAVGTVFGGLAGYFSGSWLDELIIWIYGCLDSIPFYLFVAAVSFALSDSGLAMYVAMVGVMWTGTCKVVRGQVIRLRHFEFVEAARAIGVSDLLIIYRHILPNTIPLLLIELTLAFVTAIKTEAILSFLGLGIRDGVSWGVMLSEASAEVVAGHYHNFLAASGFMFGLVMAFNQFSDALQDALDPRKVS